MARIKLYQRNPAQQYVGVPPADNSGSIIANAVASSANLLADQANQTEAQNQYMARFMLNQATQDIGQAIRRQQQLDAKQQEYNDFTSAQNALTSFTMDTNEEAERTQTADPNAPENWAQSYRESATQRMEATLQKLTPGAQKLAMSGMNNTIEANHKSLLRTGADQRSNLNDIDAVNNSDRVVASGVNAGSQGLKAYVDGRGLLEDAASTRLIKTPAPVVDKWHTGNVKAYTANFLEGASIANPGSVEDLMKAPELQSALALFDGKELQSIISFDKQRQDDYYSYQTLQERNTFANKERSNSSDLSFVYDNILDDENVNKGIEVLKAMKSRYAQEINDLQKDGQTLTPKQAEFYGERENWLDSKLVQLQGFINANATREEKVAGKEKRKEVADMKYTIRNDYQSDEASAARTKLQTLYQQLNRYKSDSSRKQRLKSQEAGRQLIKYVDELRSTHPTWLAEPTIDPVTKRVIPAKQSHIETLLGNVDEHMQYLADKKPQRKSFVDSFMQTLTGEPDAATKQKEIGTFKSTLPPSKRIQYDSVVNSKVQAYEAQQTQNGRNVTNEDRAVWKAHYEKYYKDHPEKIPEPLSSVQKSETKGPPLLKPGQKNLFGQVTKGASSSGNKTKLVPPPPPNAVPAGMNDIWQYQYKGIPIDELRKLIQQDSRLNNG